MSGTITANQFFENGGLRIDLDKVQGFEDIVSDPAAFIRLDGVGIYVGELTLDKIKRAHEAYRESLKPKYQLKDGWYICDLGENVGNRYVLRYFEKDVSYSANGDSQMWAGAYDWSVIVDYQPPRPNIPVSSD